MSVGRSPPPPPPPPPSPGPHHLPLPADTHNCCGIYRRRRQYMPMGDSKLYAVTICDANADIYCRRRQYMSGDKICRNKHSTHVTLSGYCPGWRELSGLYYGGLLASKDKVIYVHMITSHLHTVANFVSTSLLLCTFDANMPSEAAPNAHIYSYVHIISHYFVLLTHLSRWNWASKKHIY